MPSRADMKRALRQTPPQDRAALFNLAIDALAAGLEDDLRNCLEVALQPANTANRADHRLWQVLGLAHRALDDSAAAHRALSHAARLAPAEPLIAHSTARTALEAGFPATALFDHAARLAPADGSVLMGRAAAQLAEGQGEEALAGLAQVLASSPGWLDGHLTYARLCAIVDPGTDRMQTLRAALIRFPQEIGLWLTLLRAYTGANDHAGALQVLPEAEARLGARTELTTARAICLGESGDPLGAQALFDRLPPPTTGDEALWPLRNLIRLGRYDEASRLAERDFTGAGEIVLWPYRALLWRLLGNSRWEWLEGDPRLISVHDLSCQIDLDAIADVLRGLHRASAQPLEQSVRGGTQTDGHLFARAEPEIRALRAAILKAVHAHVAQLPPFDASHPTLGTPRAPIRFAGSWSVRLAGQGHHSDHVHTHGWLSSAFYVALPDPMGQGRDDEAGCLAFGECRALLPDLDGFRIVRPARGHLVLFPSTMWHGTRPFTSGERLTAAFDVAVPKGEA